MYCEIAHKEYLNSAKSKKPGADKIRSVIKGQLQYLRRDLGYIEGLMADGRKLEDREMKKFIIIRELYTQQKYMYDNKWPFSLSKRCNKMGLVTEYLDHTVHTAVGLLVLTTNLFKILDVVQSLFSSFIGMYENSWFTVGRAFRQRFKRRNIHRKCIIVSEYAF